MQTAEERTEESRLRAKAGGIRKDLALGRIPSDKIARAKEHLAQTEQQIADLQSSHSGLKGERLW